MTTSALYPTHTVICNVPLSSSAFQTLIQPQRPGRFSNASQRRALIGRYKINQINNNIEYPLEHCKVNYTLNGVSIHSVTTKIQASFLTQLLERKEKAQEFHHDAMMTLKQKKSLMAVIGEN